ncbi:hypothetical protein Lesp02_11820 [Lentzea sp. NBRC 105346]|uniref:hypothetical protein n=1 Tax=Lentzea sp. NBRC 105346 TaxID=3032205 RepID=UPI0024A407CF|nr:hypothetical protein [Lentzea sp. NBRC 105346]GLZ28992.1 hypothetical protein Lesp02_11820 [Lentzea sp. NBRC 105346]
MTLVDRSGPELLGVYLNDHYTGSVTGGELASRIAEQFKKTPAAPRLRKLAADVQEDRVTLVRLMKVLGHDPKAYRAALGWVGEKAGRLKLNGYLVKRSPLSAVLELETMMLGVQGKAALWRSLRELKDARLDEAELDNLSRRAEQQIELLEELRVTAAREVFSAG